MSTGYTTAIEKGITFKDFALRCARAFGALVSMRDDSLDAQIPREFKPSDYYKDELDAKLAELERIKGASTAVLQEDIHCENAKSEAALAESRKKALTLKAKYEDMLEQVKTWTPPTSDHTELKSFMIQQITDSIRHDCSVSPEFYPRISLSPEEYRLKRIKELGKDIKYYSEEYERELERTKSRNLWIKQLRESL